MSLINIQGMTDIKLKTRLFMRFDLSVNPSFPPSVCRKLLLLAVTHHIIIGLLLISDDETHQGHLQRVGNNHQQQEEHGQRDVRLHHRPHRAQRADRQVIVASHWSIDR